MSGLNSISNTRVSDLYARNQLLVNIQNNQAALTRLEQQISTGQKFQYPSDDPNSSLRGIAIQTLLGRLNQVQTNLNSTTSFLNASDSALSSVNTSLNQALSLAQQSIGANVTPQQQAVAAQSVDQILTQVIAAANTMFNGRSLFAGSATGTTAFTRTSNGVVYNGNDQAVNSFDTLHSLMQTNIDGNRAFGALTAAVGGTGLTPQLTNDTPLTQLQNGTGVAPGKIVVSDGTHSSTIDISGTATLGDVAQLIMNNPPAGRTITARVTPAGLALQLDSAGGGNLTVTDSGAGTTAEQLGIASTASIGTGPLVGAALSPTLLPTTALADLFGTRASAYVASSGVNNDLVFTAPQNGAGYNGATIKFIDSAHLQSGPGIVAGHEQATYYASATSAVAALNLSGASNDLLLTATTAGTSMNGVTVQVVDGGTLGNAANASYNSSTKTLTVQVDHSGQTSTQALIAAINGEGHFTAARDATGESNSSGGTVPATAFGYTTNTYNTGNDANTLAVVVQSGFTTANDVIDAVNAQTSFHAALDPAETDNAGTGIITDSYTSSSATGTMAGGSGTVLDTAGLQVVSGGKTFTIDTSGDTTVQNLLDTLNQSGADLYARINSTGNGIEVQSRLSGGSLSIGENGGQTATQLGIRTLTTATALTSLNIGQGVTTTPGTSFTITRKDGVQFNVDVSSAVTIGDVINAINNNATNLASGVPVVARLNTVGNGIELTEDGPPSPGAGTLSVTTGTAGAAAIGLGLIPAGATGSSATAGAVATGNLTSGTNANLVISAASTGTAVNGARVVFTNTGSAPESATYNTSTKTLTLGINPGTTTANQVISAIAADPTASQYFTATLAAGSDGTGTVSVAASATLSGGTAETLAGADVNPLQVNGVFTALVTLRNALQAGNTSAIGTATTMLQSSISQVAGARAEIGVRLQGIDSVQTRFNADNTNLQATLSQDMDTDLATVISNLLGQQVSYQASLQTSGTISRLTLLNYL